MDPFIEIQQALRIAELKQYTDTELIIELRRRGVLVILNGKDTTKSKEVGDERGSDRRAPVSNV